METITSKKHIDSFLAQSDSLRFKLWAIVGRDEIRKQNIINYLTHKLDWQIIDVQQHLLGLYQELDQLEEPSIEVGIRVKEWFNSLPNKIILTNASILYHKTFTRLSPIGAFKYNSRNKNCIVFLEDEEMISNRLYYGKVGTEDFYDKDINDIVITKIGEILEDYTPSVFNDDNEEYQKLTPESIGNLFNFTEIKDVIDIDTDLKHEDLQRELVSSYIISDGLEEQILDFFDNLKKPNHKAVKILGNYGSGKSHLIAFLVSTITRPDLRHLISNSTIQKACEDVSRKFLTVQFELQPVSVDLSYFFFKSLEKQLKQKYSIEIPVYSQEIIDFKEHIDQIILAVKTKDPSAGLLVIVDELSDFLSTKPENEMSKDFQFLRVIAQECQSQDILVMTSMQEDIYSSPRFKNIAAQAGRIDQRFQNIVIYREAVQQVISQRIVSKSSNQKAGIEEKLKPYAAKIEDVSVKMDQYIELFPFTPFLLELFNELPYFEKRGVIQFAQSELKYRLGKKFPYFFTFEKIFDVLEKNPNTKNLEKVYDTIKIVAIIKQKIVANLESKFHEDALKIIKGLSIYSLWSNGHNGASARELAEKLLILPQNKAFESQMQVSLIVKKIREATDGFYLKVIQDPKSGNDYFKFDPGIDGTDPDERIDTEVTALGPAEDRIESLLFEQIREILDLQYYNNTPDVFNDECIWSSAKSFRKGYIIFTRKGADIPSLPSSDYYINFISPYYKGQTKIMGENHLEIRLVIPGDRNIEHLKRIVAIRSLISKNILTAVMNRKLTEEIEGTRVAGIPHPGIKYKIARWVYADSVAFLNDKPVNIKNELGKEYNNLSEIVNELKKSVFDDCFSSTYPEHPKYSQLLSSSNINDSLTRILDELTDGNFNRITTNAKSFLNSLSLLNSNGDVDISNSKFAQKIYAVIADNKGKVVNIQSELVESLKGKPYGLEHQLIYFNLVILTILGRISLKAKGGDEIDIANVKDKFRSVSQFENIIYALKKENLSFDFASRLMKALGLNGNLIQKEETRNEAFLAYKKKVREILQLKKDLETMINALLARSANCINTADVSTYQQKCQVIDWNILDIANQGKFNEIEHLNGELGNIKNALENLENLKQAVQLYNQQIYDGIQYMNDALDIIGENPSFLPDPIIAKRLQDFSNDTKNVVRDFGKYIRPDERIPLEGKIKAFKDIYVKEFYYPAHESTIGKKVNWKPYDYYINDPVYKQCLQLSKLDCNVKTKINHQTDAWNSISKLRCTGLDIDTLYKIPFHPACNFLKEPRDYSKISTEAKKISTRLTEIKNEYKVTTVSEIEKNSGQLKIVRIGETEKKAILKIIETGIVPDDLNESLIKAINELFKDIRIVTITKEKLLKALFKENELLTREQFKESLINFENSILMQEKGDDFRIKFEE